MSTDLKHLIIATQLSNGQQGVLGAALQSAHRGNPISAATHQSIREVVHACGDLRRSPEQCLVAFKSYLASAANEAGIPLGRERAVLLDRFVSLFIEEMYRVESEGAIDDLACRGKSNGTIPAGNRELPDARP